MSSIKNIFYRKVDLTYDCFDVETLGGLDSGNVLFGERLQDRRLARVVEAEDENTRFLVSSLEGTQKIKKTHIDLIFYSKYYKVK